MKIVAPICFILLFTSSHLLAEPWVDTTQLWLRADIEYLADKGVINAPITTWPLMWAPVVKSLDHANDEMMDEQTRMVYWRVKKAAKEALRYRPKRTLSLSLANGEQVLRSFGESSRGEAEIAASVASLSKHMAYKLKITNLVDSLDGDDTRFDGSYGAVIINNWVLSAGYIEKWWGPGWDSTNLLSNNARPIPQVMIQRNYSDPFDTPILNWLGPWTFNFFLGKLDDDRLIQNAKFWGMAVNFKPLDSLEVSLRRVGLWGGDDRPNELTNLWDVLAFSSDDCLPEQRTCEVNESRNQIAGFDIRWQTGIKHFRSFYASLYGGNEIDGLLPSGRFWQVGLNGSFEAFQAQWHYFAETSNTFAHDGFDRSNVTYENYRYPAGYRYNRLAMGSTYDNDSEVWTLGAHSQLDKMNRIQIKLTKMDLNQDDTNRSVNALHSVNQNAIKAKRLQTQWQHQTMDYGTLTFTLNIADKVIDGYGRQSDRYRAVIDWSFGL